MHRYLFQSIWVITLVVLCATQAWSQELPSLDSPQKLWSTYLTVDSTPTQQDNSSNKPDLSDSATLSESIQIGELPERPEPESNAIPFAGDEATFADDWPTRSASLFVGYDAWRGTPDGGWENNGIHTGVNLGSRLGRLSDWAGIGAQCGGSMGVYNWSGTDYRMAHQQEAQPQGFLTYGLFRRAQGDSNWNAALAHDWMFNNHYSVFSESPTLAQWRGQLGYAISPCEEFGIWGTWRLLSDTCDVRGFGPVTWRPMGQLNPYWHHKWEARGADTWLWVGLPEKERLTGSGSLGDYIVGAAANCPLNERVALYTLITYMHPSASAGPEAARDDAWNFTIGISFYPARNARSNTVAGQTWMPLLPVANNGYFLVDASDNY